MRLKIKLIIIFMLLVLLTGCYSNKINEVNGNIESKKPLQLIEVIVPKNFPKPVNLDDIKIKYSNSESNSIQLIFNKKLNYNNEYILGYFQRNKYYEICSKFNEDKAVFFKYYIQNDRINIDTSLSSYPGELISIYVPNNIEDIYGNKLSHDEILLFSYNKVIDENIYSSVNYLPEREESASKILIKQKEDNKKIFFLNENAQLYSDENKNNTVMNLYRGETVILKSIEENICNVDIYLNIENSDDSNCTNIVNGYVEYSKLTEIPEPLNNDCNYIVCITGNSESGSPVVEFVFINELYGYESMYIEEGVKNIEKEDLHKIESSILFSWPAFLMGESCSTTYSVANDKKQGYVSSYDIEAHIPEYYWDENNYNIYCKAFNMLTDYIINRIKNYNMCEEMKYLNKRIIESCERFRIVEKTWVDWAYEQKLDKNYFFDEVLNRLNLSENDIKNMQLIFENIEKKDLPILENIYVSKESALSDELFSNKYHEIHNNILLDSEVSKYYSELTKLIRSKYSKIESVIEEEPEVSTEEILVWGEIISVIDDQEDINFVVEDKDGNTYNLRIDKDKRNDITIKEGLHIRTVCHLVNGIYETDGRDCFVY